MSRMLFYRSAPTLVDPAQALPGRDTPILPQPLPHAVLGTPITGPWREGQRAVYIAIGCFWGAEKLLWNIDGVESTAAGYAGGHTPNPTYREVCSGLTNHTETVQVVFDPERVSLREIVATALENHDPTQGFRQGNDVGTQYRSAIFTTTEHDAEELRPLLDAYADKLRAAGIGEMTTELGVLPNFYLAEEEHQQYLHKVPGGYCPNHATGVACGI